MGKAKPEAAYGKWLAALKRADLLPTESLLPRIVVPECALPTPGMIRSQGAEPSQELLANVAKENWGYWFPLGKRDSTLGKERALTHRSRQLMLYRMNSINGAISALYGGDLTGKGVLDLACNHGAFGLDLAARGAPFTRGVDLREENVAKARLLAEQMGIEAATFEVGDIYEETTEHDIVLCLGVLYHVAKPYELVELCHRLCTDMAVIDTVTHREPFSGFILGSGQMIGRGRSNPNGTASDLSWTDGLDARRRLPRNHRG